MSDKGGEDEQKRSQTREKDAMRIAIDRNCNTQQKPQQIESTLRGSPFILIQLGALLTQGLLILFLLATIAIP